MVPRVTGVVALPVVVPRVLGVVALPVEVPRVFGFVVLVMLPGVRMRKNPL